MMQVLPNKKQQVLHQPKSESIWRFYLKQNVNSFFIKKGTFSCQISGKTAKMLMKTFFVVTTTKLLSHFFLCFHDARTIDFIHQHTVDFLLHRLSCVLIVMESDNISCLPNPFCKCIAFRFRIHNLSHKLLLSFMWFTGEQGGRLICQIACQYSVHFPDRERTVIIPARTVSRSEILSPRQCQQGTWNF